MSTARIIILLFVLACGAKLAFAAVDLAQRVQVAQAKLTY